MYFAGCLIFVVVLATGMLHRQIMKQRRQNKILKSSRAYKMFYLERLKQEIYGKDKEGE